MEQILISQTKNYLILKIPLQSKVKSHVLIEDREKKAVLDGLKAVQNSEVSSQFDNVQGAVSFLRKL
ncbi:hypothetical protein COX24_02980 [bacterium (Candidatus Gribaldobacteria) CG23_combo_of_CG06-09_8_20_14_all_37_87_8]|uniref:Uncharacterized protein n=2 Tax=Candidatus Gribaldobacteria TaxID=2798536 RepID=A0A2G9ZEN5_9BACT|nr:MAG: hypothetical protein AUJ25_02180 [Parcubacteria group bacterium CG1_02_37_13]PIP31571.1 MAG: hypothetical protein COX24_02980 [bacterium (Candidatus Gribaldobacteria) CG23_combo_of_CG06-09_8_20_14_all_37_87_8]PIR90629.1 MAG: hypothetical protein COU05_01025 [bacterium (Candidatus Gribaldobacteria) CG10_big_fil_rev_8_21_14_0_10_37_21]